MTTHALYRFYAADDRLLYIGITADPGHRFAQHCGDKPWWSQVARIELATYPDRAAVLDAERLAIIAEKPKHNVMHNGRTSAGPSPSVPQLDRLLPVQVGDWAAFGLADGRCPVGRVEATDGIWLSIRLKNFLMGFLDTQIVAVRWTEVERIELAYPEDAHDEHGERIMEDEHLGDFQAAWQRAHFGASGRDAVEALRLELRREREELHRAMRQR